MGRFKNWFSGLSKTAQVAIVSVTVLLGLGTAGSFASTPPPATKSVVNSAPQTKAATITTETITETTPVVFGKKTVETSSLNKGVTQVTTTGVDGVKTLTYEVTKTNGVVTNRKFLSEAVTTTPVDEVTSIGTYIAPAPAPRVASNCDPNYSPCVPNVGYDLDCGDIGFSVRVLGSDPHGFDRDNDGYGCESY